jgi:hypothetical protein
MLETVKHSRVTVIVVGLLSESEGEQAEATLSKIAEAPAEAALIFPIYRAARTMMERAACITGLNTPSVRPHGILLMMDRGVRFVSR